MSTKRTVWHFSLTVMLRKYGPPWVEVRDEVTLSKERPRIDYLLLRKHKNPPAVAPDRTLRGLWRRLRRVTVVEYKSVSRPYRRRDLDRLWGYTSGRARDFWVEQIGTKEARMAVQNMEGYDEAVRRFLEDLPPKQRLAGLSPKQRLAGLPPEQRLAGLSPKQRLAGLPPEQRLAGLSPKQRLAGLPPEQRLAGLSREERLLAMSDEDLRLLPEEYLATFPKATREAVRKRLGGVTSGSMKQRRSTRAR